MRGNITTGQDAFLDIVANLVGILIILVVLVSAHARSDAGATPEPEAAMTEQVTAAALAADQAASRMDVLIQDNEEIEVLIDQENAVARQLTEVRHQRLVALEELKTQMAAKQSELDARDQALFQQQSETITLQRQLKQLTDTVAAVSSLKTNTSDAKTIDHYPNPIASTVFSQEVHFRLTGGKLVYVPMDQLVNKMKQDWQLIAERKTEFNTSRDTIGPIGNFRLQYELETSIAAGSRRQIRFKRFALFPVVEDAGEPTEVALSNPTSHWNAVLKNLNPAQTTVSIWVYPDSFSDHAMVKKWLYDNGYKMASWPLEFGRLISGGPDGLKTSAQ
jgi:hypothetical protein